MPDRPIPFRCAEFIPGTTERRGSGLVTDIDAAVVLVLVLADLSKVSKTLTPHIPPGVQDANDVVTQDLCVVRLVTGFRVLVRRPRC